MLVFNNISILNLNTTIQYIYSNYAPIILTQF